MFCLTYVLSMQLFGVELVGVNAQNGRKLLLSFLFAAAVFLIAKLISGLLALAFRRHPGGKILFWSRQAISVGAMVAGVIGLVSIWFDDPTRLAGALGLVTAALVFALQRVVTAVAGYVLILRGKTFTIGDRITMGGVRGDVIALGFLQTTIMEMGQPPAVQNADPAMWVRARQYSGRIVTVTNAKVFDEPVFNYTRDLPYLWEEMMVPVPYSADPAAVEKILLDAARRRTTRIAHLGEHAIHALAHRYGVHDVDLEPRVFWRLTDNWLELTVRFLVADHEIREVKDAMSRDILSGLQAAHIGVASSTYDIVGMPPLRVRMEAGASSAPGDGNGSPVAPAKSDQTLPR